MSQQGDIVPDSERPNQSFYEDPPGCVCPQDYVKTRCPVHDPDGTYYGQSRVVTADEYIGQDAAVAILELKAEVERLGSALEGTARNYAQLVTWLQRNHPDVLVAFDAR